MSDRPPIKAGLWGAWAGAALAAFAAAFVLNLTYVYGAQLIDPAGAPGLAAMRMFVSPLLTLAAFALVVLSLVFMLFRRFPRVLIGALVLIALLLFAHAGVEAFRLMQAA